MLGAQGEAELSSLISSGLTGHLSPFEVFQASLAALCLQLTLFSLPQQQLSMVWRM
jgi:hypothetical protein